MGMREKWGIYLQARDRVFTFIVQSYTSYSEVRPIVFNGIHSQKSMYKLQPEWFIWLRPDIFNNVFSESD